MDLTADLSDELVEKALRYLGLSTLRAAAVTCKRWATLSKPLLADGVLLMLAQVLTNAKQRARQLAYAHKTTQHITAAADSAPEVNEAVVSARAVRAARRSAATSSTPDGRTECLAPLPEVGEGELAAASAALALLRPMPEYGHDLMSCEAIDKFNALRPKFDDEEAAILAKVDGGGRSGLTGPEWDAQVDPLGRERSSVATYMMGGTLRVGDGGETARERECRASGGRIETPLGDLTLGDPGAPRTQLCCFDGAGRKFSWTTERPHLKATPLEQRMICLAELYWGGRGDMDDAQPFTRESKVLAYDVLFCKQRSALGVYFPTPPGVCPEGIKRLAVFSYPELTPLSYFGSLDTQDGECYGDMTLMRSASPCDDEPREWAAVYLGEETPRGEIPLRQLPGENGLGLAIS